MTKKSVSFYFGSNVIVKNFVVTSILNAMHYYAIIIIAN